MEQLDVFFKYTITSENNKFISEIKETRAIEEGDKFRTSIDLPKDLSPGSYKLYVEITYDDGKIAVAQDTFRVLKLSSGEVSYYVLITILVALIMITVILIMGKSKKH